MESNSSSVCSSPGFEPFSEFAVSKLNYEWKEGRLFVLDEIGPYPLAGDFAEIDRLNLQHYILRYALKGYFVAPLEIEKIRTLCDVGCGAGTWTMEMAATYPHIECIGCDIQTMYPQDTCPKNCDFQVCDIFEGLEFPSDHFDYIYQRTMSSTIPESKWVSVLSELVRIVKPGGWVELTEMSFTINNRGPHHEKVANCVFQGLKKRGIHKNTIKRIPKFCVQAGLTDVSVHHLLVPVGDWGGQLGKIMLENILNVLEAYREFVVKQKIFSDIKSEWDDHVDKIAGEVNEYRSTVNVYVFTGKKPMANESNEDHENYDDEFSDDEMNEDGVMKTKKVRNKHSKKNMKNEKDKKSERNVRSEKESENDENNENGR